MLVVSSAHEDLTAEQRAPFESVSKRITKKQTGYHLDQRPVALPMVSVSYIVEDDRTTDLQVICERVGDELIVYGLIGDPVAITEITQGGNTFDAEYFLLNVVDELDRQQGERTQFCDMPTLVLRCD